MEENMDLGLRDKVAVITGGSVGIGLAVAEGLAAEGANLVISARGKDRLDAEAARIADKFGVIVHSIAADVATAEGCNAVITGVAKAFGGADILINNAGTGSNETIQAADDAKWQLLLGSACDGRRAAGARAGAGHEDARRRGDPAQRLDLCRAAALV
jgi:3-oxoacyl-[acyl-carrier protein] reductase